jgi:AcrR family transcriptional regulator
VTLETVTTPETPRGPGRPRDTAVEEAVLTATIELLTEFPSADDVTIAAITTRSGISRAAIYRRWSSREELLAAALDSVRSEVKTTFTGDLRVDLANSFAVGMVDVTGASGDLVRKRIVLGLQNDKVREASWQQHVSRRRVHLTEAMSEAQAAGTLDSSVDTDVLIDLIVGMSYYQFVVRGPSTADGADDRVRAAIELLWRGVQPRD